MTVLFVPLLGWGQGTAITTNDWTLVSGTAGWASQNNGYGKLQYVSSRKLHCWFEFYKQSVTTEVNQALGCWSLPENRWHLFQAHGGFETADSIGPGHTVSGMSYNSDLDLYSFQADSSGSQQPYELFPGDLESYDFTGLTGRITTFSPRPWLEDGNTPLTTPAIYMPSVQRTIRWSQLNGTTTGPNNVFSCNDATNVCTQIVLTGALPVQIGNTTPSARLDTTNNKIYFTGGGQAGMFTFTCTNGTCTTATGAQLTPSCTGADCASGAPPARIAAGFEYSPDADKFMMVSGGAAAPSAFCVGMFTDNWMFDPAANSGNGAWTELAPAHNYTNAGCTSFDRLSYDRDSKVFVLINNANQIYLYPMTVAGSNYGRAPITPTLTAGYLNHWTTSNSAQSFGYAPMLAPNGAGAALTFLEAGTDGDSSTTCTSLFHPYVQTLSGAAWTDLPAVTTSSCTQLDSESGTPGSTLSANTSVAYVAGTLYELHANSTSSLTVMARSRTWNGSVWSAATAVPCFAINPCDGATAQKPMKIFAVGTTPTEATIETVRDNFVPDNYLYVAQLVAGVWTSRGGKWNRSAAPTRAEEADCASDGTNFACAWTERIDTARDTTSTTPQVFVSNWSGAAVVTMGTSLNISAGDWSSYPQIVRVGSVWYTCWTERAVGGPQQGFCKSWNGSAWSAALGGGTFNVDTSTGWMNHLSCFTDGTDLYCGFSEQAALGSVSKGYVKKWSVAGAAWSQLGGAFNADATNGSASGVTGAWSTFGGGRPTVAWSELKYGNLSMIHAAQFNGSLWVAPGAPNGDTCALVAPASGNVISRFFNLVATATAGGGSMNTLQLTLDGNALGSDLGGAGSFIWDTQTIANGSHTLAGTCGDTVGGTGVLASVTITVNNHPGLGASIPTCVDPDGDGYGAGPGCAGPDADQHDATVHTTAQAVAKWGTMAAFLTHLGYNPLRYRVISPSGNDGTCTVHNLVTDPDPTAVTACATYAHVQGLIIPGDLTFYRAGTYTDRLNIYLAASGTIANPVIYMAYPGEAVTISNSRPVDACNDPSHVDYWTLDGFNLTAPSLGGGDDGVLVCEHNGFTIRNNDIRYTTRGIFGAQDMNDGLIEFNIVHDTNGVSGTHTLYLGARDLPNARLTIANNIFYNPGLTCMQHNGRVGNLTLDGNMCYGVTNASGISLEMGAHDSLLRDNLVFNTDVKPLVIFDYPEQSCVGSPDIIPYDQNHNVIENNTFVVGSKKNDGSPIGTTPNISISGSLPVGSAQDLGNNTFRNNLLINYSGGVPLAITTSSWNCSCYDSLSCAGANYSGNGAIDPNTWAATLTWTKNDVWSLSSPSSYAMNLSNVQGVQGTVPGGNPSPVTSNLSFSAWQAYNGTTTGNLTADPLFTAYDNLWYATPANYNFRPGAGSPAIHGGTSTGVPLTDLVGSLFASPPAIGALERLASIALKGWTLKGWVVQ